MSSPIFKSSSGFLPAASNLLFRSINLNSWLSATAATLMPAQAINLHQEWVRDPGIFRLI